MKKKLINGAITMLVLVVACFSLLSIKSFVSKDIELQTYTSIKQAIVDAAIQCCAIEGAYPSSLSYLESYYGLQIDHDNYFVSYELFASNILPDITVLAK